MRTTTRTITTATAVLLAGAALTATAATATAAPATTAPAHASHFSVGANGRLALDDLSSNGGYGIDLSRFASPKQWTATVTFVVPTVTCTKKTTAPLFIQTFFDGTDKHGNGLGEGAWTMASCNPDLTASYSVNVSATGGTPGGANFDTAAGDTVTFSFAATRDSEVSTATDVTTGATGSDTGTGFKSDGGMQVSVQGGFGHEVFPRFSTIHFTKVLGGGLPMRAFDPGNFNAQDAAGNVKIQAQPIDANGKGFVDKFVAEFTPDA